MPSGRKPQTGRRTAFARARGDASLRQEDVVQRVNAVLRERGSKRRINRFDLTRWENGHNRPDSLAVVSAIAEVTNKPLEFFADDEDEESRRVRDDIHRLVDVLLDRMLEQAQRSTFESRPARRELVEAA